MRRVADIGLLALCTTCIVCPSLLLTASHAAATPSMGGFSAQAGLHPGDPAAPPYFALKVGAGSITREQVVVTNHSGHAMRFAVSAVDGLTGTTSGAVFAGRHDPVGEAGRWVTPAWRRLTVPAHERVVVRFSAQVPEGTPDGEYLAGVAVERLTPERASSRGSFAVTQVVRAVVGILMTVGTSRFEPVLTSLSIEELPGPKVAAVHVGLGNSGRGLGRPLLEVAVDGPGDYHRVVTRRLDTILASDHITYPDAWPDDLAPGSYRVAATLTHRKRSVTRSAIIDLPDALRGTAAPAADAPDLGGTPWTLLALFLTTGLALGAGAGIVLRRRPGIGRQA